MPQGLTESHAHKLLENGGNVWVHQFNSSEDDAAGKVKKPMRLLRVDGNYGIVRHEGDEKPIRILIDKLETTRAPEPRLYRSKHFPDRADLKIVTPSSAPITPASNDSSGSVKWVLFDPQNKRYYTAARQWKPEFNLARQYDTNGGARVALSRLINNTAKGRELTICAAGDAKKRYVESFSSSSEEPEMLTSTTLPPPQKPHLVNPAPKPTPESPMQIAFNKWESARREERTALAMHMELQGKLQMAEAELEIADRRAKLGL